MKPRSPADAYDTLKFLKNDTHSIVTAIYVYVKQNGVVRELMDYDYTNVTFCDFQHKELLAYILRGIHWGKVGGYSINADPDHFIVDVEGSLTSAYGLPFEKLNKIFKELNLEKHKRSMSNAKIEKMLKHR